MYFYTLFTCNEDRKKNHFTYNLKGDVVITGGALAEIHPADVAAGVEPLHVGHAEGG